MTTLRQAFHVAAKDLRESWWPLVAYGALVVLATLQASSQRPLGPLNQAMFFVVMAGMVVVSLLVQADSPVRPDAFWATRPLNPFAVLSAKLLLTLAVIVGLPLVGQIIALRVNGADASDLARFLPSGVLTYGLWLFAAFVVASYTSDLRTVVVVLLCIAAGLVIGLLSALSGRNTPEPSLRFLAGSQIVAWLGVLGSAVLVVALYRRRTRVRGWTLAMVIGVACTLYAVTGALFTVGTPTPIVPRKPSSASPSIAVSINSQRLRFNESNLNVDLTAQSLPPNTQLSFLVRELVLDLRDGSSLRLPTGYQTAEFGSARPPLPGREWVTLKTDSIPRAAISASLDFDMRRRIEAGIARVRIAGELVESRSHAVSSLPLVRGASAVSHGQRVQVDGWSFGSGEAALKLRTRSLPFEEAKPSFGFPQAVRYVLVNDEAREAIPLSWSGGGGGSAWLVLPGIQASEMTFSLAVGESWTAPKLPSPRTDDWFRAAHLEVFSWEPVAVYEIRAEGTVR